MNNEDRVKGWESVLSCDTYGSIFPWQAIENEIRMHDEICVVYYTFPTLAKIIAIRASKREWKSFDDHKHHLEVRSIHWAMDYELNYYSDEEEFVAQTGDIGGIFCYTTVCLEILDFVKQCPDLHPTESMFRALTDEIHEQYVDYEQWLDTQKLAKLHGVDPDNGGTARDKVEAELGIIYSGEAVLSAEEVDRLVDHMETKPIDYPDGKVVEIGIRELDSHVRTCVTAVFKK